MWEGSRGPRLMRRMGDGRRYYSFPKLGKAMLGWSRARENKKGRGSRELNNLSCSIHYEKGKEQEVERSSQSKGGIRCQGEFEFSSVK